MAIEPIVPGSGGVTPGYTIPITGGSAMAAPASGAASGIGAALISGGIDYFSAKQTNRKAKKLAREQMSFQERMSNTAYQRAVKDMRAAGINPMLAYMKGGASAPTGAQPSLRAPALDTAKIATAANVGSQAAQRKLQNLNLQQTNSLIQSQAALAEAQTSSARGVAKQQNTIGDFYLKHPELAPSLQLGGGAGAAATGASSLGRMLKGIVR